MESKAKLFGHAIHAHLNAPNSLTQPNTDELRVSDKHARHA